MALANPDAELPTTTIALSLLVGFSLMLLVEQLSGSHSHADSPGDGVPRTTAEGPKSRAGGNQAEFDVELGELEDEQGIPRQTRSRSQSPVRGRENDISTPPKQRPLTLTIGLVIHGLADGLALGASALATADSTAASDLSFVVFLALAIHKGSCDLPRHRD